ncbi:MAG: four helix bundle protein [Clostridia bacterium]|nr:four helix bundle protein [Clostridia bacterium]
MSSALLKDKSKAFANRIVTCCRVLRERGAEAPLINQLLRSGTSVGANIAEAQFAQGDKDFISKMEIALKEINETEYWLELLFNAKCINNREFLSMRNDCIVIRKLLISSVITVKKRINSLENK